MANEIALSAASGQTLYVLLRNSAGQPYNTVTPAFEAYQSGHYTSYAISLAEQGSTGFYLGSVPAGVGAQGRYSVQAKQQVGAGPAPRDTTLGVGVLLWNGTAEVDVLSSADKAGYSSTVSGYAAGQDPASLVLLSAANKLRTNASGQVQSDMTQAVPTSNTAQSVGDALNGARAQAFGKWVLSGTTLQLFAADGTTVVRTFALDNALAPSQRS